MKQHRQEHEELLLAIVVDCGDPRQAFAGSELDGCDVCGESLDELLAAQNVLARSGEDLRENLARARKLDGVVGEHLVDQVLGTELRAGDARPAAKGLRLLAGSLAAVAAAILLAVLLVPTGDESDDSPIPLGPPATVLVVPVGDVPAFGTFAWESLAVPSGASYEVHVFAGEGESRRELRWSGPLDGSPWKPMEGATSWPDDIEWELHVYDASGELYDSSGASASRSRQ